MTEAISPAAPAPAKPPVTSDPAMRWLLTVVLVVVLVAWWHVSHRLTSVENNVSSSVSSISLETAFPPSDPVQCWMFGVGITGDKVKVDALAKGDSTNECIKQALQGARGEYLSP